MAVGSVSALLPKFTFRNRLIVIATTNDVITFTEGAGNLTATIENGTWTYGELAWKIKVALEVAGAGTYTVSYSQSARTFTLTKSVGGGTFTLDVGVTADDLLPTIGFASDQTGALTYTGTAVPGLTTVTCTQRIRGLQIDSQSNLDVTRADNGRRESAMYGRMDRITFRLEHESVAVNEALIEMWLGSAVYGDAISFYPDSTDGTNYVDVYWDAPKWSGREMTGRGLYRLHEYDFVLEIAVPAVGTYVIADFADRRPSS